MVQLEQFKHMIDESNNIVFFGGAGVSTESGIPDFRSTDGLYNQQYKYPPERILSRSFFMREPEELKKIALDALKGKWRIAIGAGLIAALLGGIGTGGPQVKLNIDGSNARLNLAFRGHNFYSAGGTVDSEIWEFLVKYANLIVIIAAIVAVTYFVVESIVTVGYARFNLDLVDGKNISLKTLFSYSHDWKAVIITQLLRDLFVLIGFIVLIIPGIIASYSFALTPYILAENPNLKAREVLSISSDMMHGRRLKLFCLQLSFIGWVLLCVLTLGIGNLWLNPYRQAVSAVFYRELCSGEEGENAFGEDEESDCS